MKLKTLSGYKLINFVGQYKIKQILVDKEVDFNRKYKVK